MWRRFAPCFSPHVEMWRRFAPCFSPHVEMWRRFTPCFLATLECNGQIHIPRHEGFGAFTETSMGLPQKLKASGAVECVLSNVFGEG